MCQEPAILGDRLGNGVLAASGSENLIVICWPPFALWLPGVGETDVICNGAVGMSARAFRAVAAECVVFASTAARLPGTLSAITRTPAVSTAPAPALVTATARNLPSLRLNVRSLNPSSSSILKTKTRLPAEQLRPG